MKIVEIPPPPLSTFSHSFFISLDPRGSFPADPTSSRSYCPLYPNELSSPDQKKKSTFHGRRYVSSREYRDRVKLVRAIPRHSRWTRKEGSASRMVTQLQVGQTRG